MYFEQNKFKSSSKNIKLACLAAKLVRQLKTNPVNIINTILERIFVSIELGIQRGNFVNIFECLRNLAACHEQIIERTLTLMNQSDVEFKLEEKMKIKSSLAYLGYEVKKSEDLQKLIVDTEDLVEYLATEGLDLTNKIEIIWSEIASSFLHKDYSASSLEHEKVKDIIANLITEAEAPTVTLSKTSTLMLKQILEYSDSVLHLNFPPTIHSTYTALFSPLTTSLSTRYLSAHPQARLSQGTPPRPFSSLPAAPLLAFTQTGRPTTIYLHAVISTFDRSVANGLCKVDKCLWHSESVEIVNDRQLDNYKNY